MDEALTLTVDAIRDFRVCELYYNYKYVKDEPEKLNNRDLLAIRFDNTMKRVASFFFYKKQANVTPSYNALLNRWEKLWFPKEMTSYDLAVEQHEVQRGNMVTYSNMAAAALEQFHADFADDPSIPILVDESYIAPLGRSIRLEGRIDLVVRHQGKIKVVKWLAKANRKPTPAHLALDFTALRIALEHRSERNHGASEFCIYDLASANSGFQVVDTPTQEDVNSILYWANEIATKELHVPRRGLTSYCKGCPFDKQCESFKFTDEMVKR